MRVPPFRNSHFAFRNSGHATALAFTSLSLFAARAADQHSRRRNVAFCADLGLSRAPAIFASIAGLFNCSRGFGRDALLSSGVSDSRVDPSDRVSDRDVAHDGDSYRFRGIASGRTVGQLSPGIFGGTDNRPADTEQID